MTAVAPPPNLQNLSRSTWGSANGSINGHHSVSADDVRILMPPRKTATRSNSSSSLSSAASSSSTVSANSSNSTSSHNGENSRKRPVRYLWQNSKSEPTAGISTARPQSIASAPAGPSATSAMSALHMPNHVQMSQQAHDLRQNGNGRMSEEVPVLYLTPMNGTFERKTIQVPFYPDVVRIGRQTNAKSIPTPHNSFFDSKVLSRAHAEVWSDRNGKIWIRDIKSSNGTFVNGQRLSGENKDSDPHELREGDMLELGIDIVSEDQKTVVHHKVAAKVEHAGYVNGQLDAFQLQGLADASPQHGLMQIQFGPNIGHQRRNSGQGTFGGSVRGQAAIAQLQNLAYQRQQSTFLLGPINMENVIKKLQAEYKMAKMQSNELGRSMQYLDSVLSCSQPEPSNPLHGSVKGKSSKRFADPPNPPPQAPLPEKPDAERKASNGSRADLAQIANLTQSLEATKQELEIQGKKLREMEAMLVEERLKRENAEARAKVLEEKQEAAKKVKVMVPNGAPAEETATTPIEDEVSSEVAKKDTAKGDRSTTEKLQERLDLVLVELHKVRESADKWKLEKEEVERERDEERKVNVGLLERIEMLKREKQDPVKVQNGAGLIREERRGNMSWPVLRSKGDEGKREGQLVQAAPYLSAVSVVMIGFAVMAIVNKMSKGER